MVLFVSILNFNAYLVLMRKVVGQVSLAFLVLGFIFNNLALAQSDISPADYVVPAVQDTLSLQKTGYYISEIKDTRSTKPNNGFFTIYSTKNSITFKDSLSSYVLAFIYPKSKQKELKPLRIEIEKLKFIGSSNGKIDEGQLYVKLFFYDSIQRNVIHTFERTFNAKKKSTPTLVSDLVYTAFRIAIVGLKRPNPDVKYNSINDVKTPNTEINQYEIAKEKIEEKEEDKTYKIPLPNQTYKWKNDQYSITGIKDIRPYNKAEGNLLIGYFNLKTKAKLDSNLEFYFKNCIDTNVESNKTPLTLYISTFQCTEVQTPDGEKGTLLLSANLVKDSAGSLYSVFKKTIELDTINENDLTKHWPSIISKAIGILLEKPEFSNPEPFIVPIIQNPIYNSNNTAISQIIKESTTEGTTYYWQGKELKQLNDFNEPFESIYNTDAYHVYKTSRTLIRTSRATSIAGGVLLAYALADYLFLEEKSLRNWYKSRVSESSKIMPIDKKIIIWTGASSLVSGIICNAIGKSQFLKAIGMHNKTIAEKISINYAPDLFNQGHQFRLNLMLGQR